VARPLRGGIPRLLPNHCTPTAVIYRRHFQALAGQFGPFTGNPFLTDYAGRVALAFVTARESGMDLARARTARERGTGRRPSVAALRQLGKRAGIDQAAYDTMLATLRGLVVQNGHGADLATRLSRVAKGRR